MRIKRKYKRLSVLIGLMSKYEITVEQLAKNIGRAMSTVSQANNGHKLYDSFDMQNIQKLINEKEIIRAKELGKEAYHYTIDNIFYS